MGDILNIEQGYKLTEEDKTEILNAMKKEVEMNDTLKVLADLPSNNGVEENRESLEGEYKEVRVNIDPKTGSKTVVGSAEEIVEKINNAGEQFIESLDKSDLETHYQILPEDIKKVNESETSFGKFDISDEATLELIKVINKYKDKGSIRYIDMPEEVKTMINSYMMESGLNPMSKVYNEYRNDLANMLIDEYINQIELNKWSDDFNIQMEKFSDEMKGEMSPLYKELNDNREQQLIDAINKLDDPDKKEKAEKALESIRDAYALTRLKEAAPRIKIKNFDLEKPQREFNSFMAKYANTQYHLYDLFMVTNVLHRHLQRNNLITEDDVTTAIKFTVALCKFCKNYNVNVVEEHAFMYFTTYNVVLLDIYTGDTYNEYAPKFLETILDIVSKLR